ncbi:MAG: hypothetical protein V8S89_05715 [Oscillospiraceae bacterium]
MNQKNVRSDRLTRAESIAGWIYLPCYLLLLSLLLWLCAGPAWL